MRYNNTLPMTRLPSEHKEIPDINLALMVRAVSAHRRQVGISLLLALVCGIIVSFCIDRSYHSQTQVVLVHDLYATQGLKNSTVRLGINVGRLKNFDAYFALMYPELMRDSRLVAHALFTPVVTCRGERMLFGEYLRHHHTPLTAADRNLMHPSPTLDSLLRKGRNYVRLRGDSRKETVMVDVHSDDPLVSEQVCRSVSRFLQDFIRDYRLSKQRSEVAHFRKVMEEHKAKLEAAQRAYVDFADSHWGQLDPSVSAYIRQLEDEVQNARHLYEGVKVECQVAEFRLQDMTPAFLVIESPSVSSRKTGIDRIFLCCACMVLAGLFSILYFIRRELWAQIIR